MHQIDGVQERGASDIPQLFDLLLDIRRDQGDLAIFQDVDDSFRNVLEASEMATFPFIPAIWSCENSLFQLSVSKPHTLNSLMLSKTS